MLFYSCNVTLITFTLLAALESSGGFNFTTKAFIFSLHNKEGLGPFKSLVTDPSTAIYRDLAQGPSFGWCDICIENNANNNTESRTNFGDSYSVPSGVKNELTILAGTRLFSPDDWEVFYLA